MTESSKSSGGSRSRASRRAPKTSKRTHFGSVFERLLEDRKYSQSSFARECQRRGFRVDSQSIIQQSVSNWLTGYRGCPRQIPLYVERILAPTDQEWLEFAVAYTYGQTLTPDEFRGRRDERIVRIFGEFARGGKLSLRSRLEADLGRGETEDDGPTDL